MARSTKSYEEERIVGKREKEQESLEKAKKLIAQKRN